MLRLNALRLGILAAACLVFLTGETGPPQPLSLFGMPADILVADGIVAFPADAAVAIDSARAQELANAHSREGGAPVQGTALIHLLDLGAPFDGIAWAVAYDVAGKPDVAPLPIGVTTSFVYDFHVVFLDAHTGEYISSLSYSHPMDLPAA